jgi:tetratricopeptide (TPR) repeat protein
MDLPTLALSMIVKNAADTIRPCLESVAGLVDQIVIADTGCTDDTCAIAREFGAIIIPFAWENHFANARNASLKAATTDWVLVLDGDEELAAEARYTLRPLLLKEDVGGYHVPIHEYLSFVDGSAWTYTILRNTSDHPRAVGAPSYMVNELCRLFRRREDLYFSGRVHEGVQPQLVRAGVRTELAPFRIHHFGHLADAAARNSKRVLYNKLVHERLSDDPTNVMSLTMCGLDEWEVHGRPLEALCYFQKALVQEPRAIETWLLSAKMLSILGRHEESLLAVGVLGDESKYAHLRHSLEGEALYWLGRFREAIAPWQKALRIHPHDRILRAKMHYALVQAGDPEPAISELKAAVADPEAQSKVHEYLVKACMHVGRMEEAAVACDVLATRDPQEVYLIQAASLWAQLRHWERAREGALDCVTSFPQSVRARELLMMAALSAGRLAEAAAAADAWARLVREPAAYVRAASIYAQLGDWQGARRVLASGRQASPRAEVLLRALKEIDRSEAVAVFAGQEGSTLEMPL